MKAYELLFFVDPSIDEETRLATSKAYRYRDYRARRQGEQC